MSLKSVQALAKQCIEDDKLLHAIYDQYESMVHGRWSLPAELTDAGVHKVVISDPYDAMNSLRRILARDIPKFKVHPVAPTEGSKVVANNMEKALVWLYKQATERRDTDLTADIAWSIGLYGQSLGQVIYLPNEIEARDAFKGDTRGLQDALAEGPFLVELHNPKFVHTIRNSYGLQGVLTKKIMRATEALSFWGEYAGTLKGKIDKLSEDEKYKAYVTQYDYWDKGKRTVWCLIGDKPNTILEPDDKSAVKIMVEEDYGLPFLPWFSRLTGSGLEQETKDKIQPMLKTLVDTGLYETQNTLETMIMSKAIKLYGRPTLVEEGPNPAEAQVDYAPENLPDTLKAPPGNTVRPLDQQVLDQALLAMSDRGSSRIDKSTVARLLQTGEFPSGMAASAINIVTQSAVESIGPFRRATEFCLADAAKLFLRHVHADGKPLVVNGASDSQQLIISPADINPSYLYVEAQLTSVGPSDDVALANAAQMWGNVGMSQEAILERAGASDPREVIKQRHREQFEEAMHQAKLADIARVTAQKDAEMQMQIQMQAQQAAMQQQAQQQQQQVAQTAGSGMSGAGVNPAAGGMSALQGNPNATFEGQMGTSRDGTPL